MKKYENFCSALCNMKEIYKYSKENVKEILIHADHSYNNKKILLSKIVAQYIESIYNE